MNMMQEFIQTYGMELISTAIVAIVGYIGMTIKKVYKDFVDDKTKEKVAKTVVKAIGQIYKDIGGEQKLEMAIANITEMLTEKGIAVGELEIRMLIEAAVAELKLGVFAVNKESGVEE